MRYCQNCSAAVALDDKFCPFCGVKLQAFQAVGSTPGSAVSENLEFSGENAAQSAASAEGENAKNPDDQITVPVIADEPATVLRSERNLASPPQETSNQLKETSNPLELGNLTAPHETADVKENKIQSEELFIATIPNIALESLAREAAEAPIEELRQEEAAEQAEQLEVSSQTKAEEENEQQISPEQAISGEDEIITEPVPTEEKTDLTGQEIEPEAAKSDETHESTSEAEADGIPLEDKTLIAQRIAESHPFSDELVSNRSDAAVPRPTEASNPKDTPGAKTPKLKPLENGTLLNRRYEIIRRIGGGGMGAVYLASDRNLGGVMRAVKEMIQAYVDESQHEKAVEDFRREALLLSSLEHPAIPTIYDYFVDIEENRFYLVMKYISGGDLAARFRAAPEGKIDEQTMTEWAIQIADVLDYLHNHEPPIVYRDLKPSNIMIDGKNGRVMLVDFGIARWVNKEEKGNTAVGTMGYAPSEQYAGNAEPRSDIYALGATMFHLLTGSDPQNNPLLIFDFTKNSRPRKINPNLSLEMEQILMRSVEYNANMRYSTAAEMRGALLDHLERLRSGRLTFAPPDVDAPHSPTSAPVQPPVGIRTPLGSAFCGFCGERIAANDMFCAFCGSKQPEAERVQAVAQTVFPTGNATARLVVETGAFDEPAFVLEKESNILGREDRRSNIFPEVDLTKFDVASPKISRRHARVFRQGAMFMVEDLGSANGTTLFTRDAKITRLIAHEPHVLMHGDKIKLGETTLHFFVN